MQDTVTVGAKSVPLRSFIDRQAQGLGVSVRGKLTRCREFETSYLEKCFVDEAGSVYYLRHGVLTVIGQDGRVY